MYFEIHKVIQYYISWVTGQPPSQIAKNIDSVWMSGLLGIRPQFSDNYHIYSRRMSGLLGIRPQLSDNYHIYSRQAQ